MKNFFLFCLVGIFFNYAYGDELFSADILEKKLIAVHATDYLPTDGILKSGFGGTEDFAQKNEKPLLDLLQNTRQTLHFSLGELVRPVGEWMSWEECTFAVIVRVKDLMPQLINLNCYDTFIFGDFQFTPMTVLVVPEGVIQEEENKFLIYEYDPSITTLRDEVDHVIQLLEGWPIRMLEDEVEDKFKEAFYEGVNINKKAFFSPLLEERPYLSVGLRFDPCDGENYRLSEIETTAVSLLNYFFNMFSQVDPSETLSVNELLETVDELETNFKVWELSVESFNKTQKSEQAFRELSDAVTIFSNLIRAEIYLNEKYEKTLRGIEKEQRYELTKYWLNLDELKSYFDTVVLTR